MCQKRARALRDLLARYRNPHLQRPTLYTQKSVCQNLIMRQSYGRCKIFLPAFLILDFAKYGHILGKTLCSSPRRQPGRQAHGGTALAPRHHVRCPWDFLGLINTSRTSLVRNNERYVAFSPAVTQAFLEGSDLRCQFYRFTFSI
jgi:hypothetical protein